MWTSQFIFVGLEVATADFIYINNSIIIHLLSQMIISICSLNGIVLVCSWGCDFHCITIHF